MSSTGPQPSFEDTRSKILLVKEKINKEVRIERLSQIYKACEYLLDNYEATKSQIDKILSLPSDVTSKTIGELQAMVEKEDDDVRDAMDSIWLFKTTYIVRAMDQIGTIRDDLKNLPTEGAQQKSAMMDEVFALRVVGEEILDKIREQRTLKERDGTGRGW
ncbi:hypothetical protein MMC22_008272, partial [Lobaria immixta]|nr:hypothetical protein [Lobaria immixta]